MPALSATRPTTHRGKSLVDWLPWKMRTLDLYLVRTFVTAYAICLLSFLGLFVVIEAFAKLERFLRQDSPLPVTLARYYVAMVPTIFTNYLGPVLTAAAGMFTVTILNRHSELSAIKATGVSVYRILAPIFVLAGILTLFTFYLQEKVIPTHRSAIRTALAFSKGRPLEPDPFYDEENGLSIRVGTYSTTLQVATDVEILELYTDNKPKLKINARQMVWAPGSGGSEADGSWRLHGFSVQRWDENGSLITNEGREGIERLLSIHDEMALDTSLRPIDLETSDTEISYLSWNDLRKQYQRQPYHRHLAVKLHHHFAFPLAHFLLLLLALPLVLNLQSRSVLVGVGLAVLLSAAFYLLSSICMSIAQDSAYFSPILAAWLPVMLFGALGITFFDQLPT